MVSITPQHVSDVNIAKITTKTFKTIKYHFLLIIAFITLSNTEPTAHMPNAIIKGNTNISAKTPQPLVILLKTDGMKI